MVAGSALPYRYPINLQGIWHRNRFVLFSLEEFMKTFALALAAAFLIAGSFFTPVAAAAETATAASTPAVAIEDCGETYTVQPQGYLSKIARTCGTSVSEILALNPQIVNANIIYTGQMLRLTGSAPASYWTTYYSPTTTSNGYAKVSLSTTTADAGDSVTVYVSDFPANASVDYRIGESGEDYTVV
jgi:LysM repeat protein